MSVFLGCRIPFDTSSCPHFLSLASDSAALQPVPHGLLSSVTTWWEEVGLLPPVRLLGWSAQSLKSPAPCEGPQLQESYGFLALGPQGIPGVWRHHKCCAPTGWGCRVDLSSGTWPRLKQPVGTATSVPCLPHPHSLLLEGRRWEPCSLLPSGTPLQIRVYLFWNLTKPSFDRHMLNIPNTHFLCSRSAGLTHQSGSGPKFRSMGKRPGTDSGWDGLNGLLTTSWMCDQ